MSRPPATSRPPTLEHVAAAAGVSRATVSRVVNGVHTVDPELRRIVEQAITQTGYVPNRAARSLARQRSGAIALVIAEPHRPATAEPFFSTAFTDPFFGRVMSGLLSALRPRGIHPELAHVDSADSRAQLLARLRQRTVDGVLVVAIDANDPLPAQVRAAGLPVVQFARPLTGAAVSYVDVAHEAGARLAADHLVARGCRRVATIAGPRSAAAGRDRLAGFRRAMARHGVRGVPAVHGDFTLPGGERAMEQLLVRHPDVDGVFVANDLMAQGALLVLGEHGRRVPDEVAVVGFDDSSVALACRPRLTTVRQPVEDMGAAMATLLLAQVEHPEELPSAVVFEPRLVVRDSA